MKRKKGTEKITEIQEELKVQLARALADYDNLKKRSEREKEFLVSYANEGLIVKLLPVLALLEKVKSHVTDQGLETAVENLKGIIKEVGIIEIKPQPGERFDETKHEAVEVIAAKEGGTGTISEVIGSGAAWEDGRLIIPARVKVYGEVSEKQDELQKETLRGDYV